MGSDGEDYKLNTADLSILYMLYMTKKKEPGLFSQSLVEKIVDFYSQLCSQRRHQVSMLCLDVSKHLKAAGIPHSLESNIANLMVDIVLKKEICGKRLVLDVHGYQHYFRNQPCRMKGSTALKRRIIESLGFRYEVILQLT